MARCGLKTAAMDVDGWGYVECDREADHPTTEGPGRGHRFGPIVHDDGAHRLASLPDDSLGADRG